MNVRRSGAGDERVTILQLARRVRLLLELRALPYPPRDCVDGRTWPTSEHYFQAHKFAGTEREELVRKAKRPHEAARLGRDRSARLRRSWESVKLSLMREAVRAKFTQHAELREKLLGTGEAKIVEHTPHDHFWADGGDGSGANWLGRILMEAREELRREGLGRGDAPE